MFSRCGLPFTIFYGLLVVGDYAAVESLWSGDCPVYMYACGALHYGVVVLGQFGFFLLLCVGGQDNCLAFLVQLLPIILSIGWLVGASFALTAVRAGGCCVASPPTCTLTLLQIVSNVVFVGLALICCSLTRAKRGAPRRAEISRATSRAQSQYAWPHGSVASLTSGALPIVGDCGGGCDQSAGGYELGALQPVWREAPPCAQLPPGAGSILGGEEWQPPPLQPICPDSTVPTFGIASYLYPAASSLPHRPVPSFVNGGSCQQRPQAQTTP
jgi:hypothetical protein